MANSINATSTGNGGIITTGDDSGVLNIQTNETTAISIDASQSVDFTNNIDAPNTFGFKNRIINGGMVIDQRNAGASVAAAGYTLDRWVAFENTSATSVTAQRSTTAPTGFTNSLLFTVGTGGSAGASEQALIRQRIEGYNVSDFAFGTASAQSITISFKVRSSVTGTYSVAVQNSAGDRSYVTTYTVDAANTWETKSVTLSGDTSGTWLTDNGIGLVVFFDLGSGSNFNTTANTWAAGDYKRVSGQANVIGTSGATFYITGVQLEKGTQATSFDFRSYGTELALCQRYYIRFGTAYWGAAYGEVTNKAVFAISLPVTMRTQPSVTNDADSSGIIANANLYNVTAATAVIENSWWNGSNGTVAVTTNSQITRWTTAWGRVGTNLQLSAEL